MFNVAIPVFLNFGLNSTKSPNTVQQIAAVKKIINILNFTY
jgi:hypothetical protein